ncbi:MAG TPA: FtsQ-type POTRA domain-containing protein, partial [bacterium]|nr:FtsQ-type POTRA domain-containing protein [bacterium]
MEQINKPGIPTETALRRKRRNKKRFYFRMSFTFVFVLFIIGAIMMNLDAFKVKIIEVSGVKRVSAEQIYKESEITLDTNLLMLPVGEIRKGIIERQPLVKDIRIHRILPSRVKIVVTERTPFAYVTDDKNFYLIDAERVVIDKPKGLLNKDLFSVKSGEIRHAGIGEKLEFPYYKLFDELCLTLERHLKGKYKMIVLSPVGIKLFLKDDTYVIIGDGSNLEKKVMLVPITEKELKKRKE